MAHDTRTLQVETTADIDVIDITDDVTNAVSRASIKNGQLCIFVGGSTASVSTIEYEPGVLSDLKRTLKEIAPPNLNYEHDKAWGDGNGYSHVLAALLGPSRVFPVIGGRIPLGTWQQIVLIDLDNKPRTRKIHLQFTGD